MARKQQERGHSPEELEEKKRIAKEGLLNRLAEIEAEYKKLAQELKPDETEKQAFYNHAKVRKLRALLESLGRGAGWNIMPPGQEGADKFWDGWQVLHKELGGDGKIPEPNNHFNNDIGQRSGPPAEPTGGGEEVSEVVPGRAMVAVPAEEGEAAAPAAEGEHIDKPRGGRKAGGAGGRPKGEGRKKKETGPPVPAEPPAPEPVVETAPSAEPPRAEAPSPGLPPGLRRAAKAWEEEGRSPMSRPALPKGEAPRAAVAQKPPSRAEARPPGRGEVRTAEQLRKNATDSLKKFLLPESVRRHLHEVVDPVFNLRFGEELDPQDRQKILEALEMLQEHYLALAIIAPRSSEERSRHSRRVGVYNVKLGELRDEIKVEEEANKSPEARKEYDLRLQIKRGLIQQLTPFLAGLGFTEPGAVDSILRRIVPARAEAILRKAKELKEQRKDK